MSKKVFNMQGGKHSAAAYSELEKWAYGSVVASANSFVVSAGSGMNVNISTGAGLISDTIARRIGTDSTETATVPTASTSFNRIDSVVAYIDTAVTPTTSVTDNTNDILKFVVVAGTAAATPAAPTGSAIVAAIGAGKPYMVLYDVTVPQNAVNTSGMTFTDRRKVLTAIDVANIPDNSLITAKYAANSVTKAKVSAGIRAYIENQTSEVATDAIWIDGKTIYKKVINLGSFPNASTKTVAHGVSTIENLVEMLGVAATGTTFIPLPYSNPITLASSMYIAVVGNNIEIGTGSNRTGITGFATMYYTKV